MSTSFIKKEESEFEKEFTHTGLLGEKKFSFFRVTNYSKKDSIIQDDQIIIDLKKWITLHDFRIFDYIISEIQRRKIEGFEGHRLAMLKGLSGNAIYNKGLEDCREILRDMIKTS